MLTMFQYLGPKCVHSGKNVLIPPICLLLTSTQIERKFVRQQQKYSLAEKKELGELDKNVTLRPPPSPLIFV